MRAKRNLNRFDALKEKEKSYEIEKGEKEVLPKKRSPRTKKTKEEKEEKTENTPVIIKEDKELKDNQIIFDGKEEVKTETKIEPLKKEDSPALEVKSPENPVEKKKSDDDEDALQ